MTDNTRAVSILDAMLNQLVGVSYVVQYPEWLGWSLGAKIALKRKLAALPANQHADAILKWLASTPAPPRQGGAS